LGKEMIRHSRSSALLIVLLFAALVAYCLPWVINPGVSLSLGAYDLAEWSSLHPAVRSGNPMLLTALLLRLPLVGIALLISIGAFPRSPTFRLFLSLLIGTALLPPLEFFTQATDDPNYRQQFVLAPITIIGSIGCLSLKHTAMAKVMFIGIAVATILSSLIGLSQTYELMNNYSLPTQLGIGGVGFIVVVGGIVFAALKLIGFKTLSKQGSPR
jgi:hypothetical protein